jgi:C4-dicarboxylate transporter DctQ subunit
MGEEVEGKRERQGLPRLIVSVIDRGSVVLTWASMITLVAMILLTGADVLLRNALNVGIWGTVEVTSNYLVVAVMVLPMAYTMSGGGHITVDLLTLRLSVRARAALTVFTMFLALIIYGWLTWYGTAATLDSFKAGEKFVNLNLPVWPGKLLIPIGALFLSLKIILSIFSSAAIWFRGTEEKNPQG